jgi:hypothetical protein
MRFDSRVFRMAKDPEHPEENQDAFAVDPRRGIAAVADGVASGIFARQWARILAEATVAEPPEPGDREAFDRWLSRRRETWRDEIDVTNLAWFQKPKLREGAFSTLVWVEILPIDEADRQPQDPWRLRAFAVGDSCLFHVRGGELLRTFPIEKAAELEANPVVVGSVDLNRDELVEFRSFEALCRPGDLVVLCTDAVAEWALRRCEAGDAPAWAGYWIMPEPAWREEVAALRHRREMRYDDATLLLLEVGDGVTAPEQPDEQAPAAEAVATSEPAGPPSLPDTTPPCDTAPHPDWSQRLRSFSEQFAGQVSEQVARGMKKLKQVRQSAESAIKRYRERLRSKDKPPDDQQHG